MKKSFWIKFVSIILSITMLTACSNNSDEQQDSIYPNNNSLPFYNSAEFTPHWLKVGSKELDTFHRIPDFRFTNQIGETITAKDMENGITVANFFFTTCPGICPLIRSKLSKVQNAYLDDKRISMFSHSIRPSNDTSEVLKIYADKNDIKTGKWHLLTGDKNMIYSLAKEAYFASEDLGEEQAQKNFLHTENVLLIDGNRHIRGIYNGLNSASVDYLIKDIAILKNEMGLH